MQPPAGFEIVTGPVVGSFVKPLCDDATKATSFGRTSPIVISVAAAAAPAALVAVITYSTQAPGVAKPPEIASVAQLTGLVATTATVFDADSDAEAMVNAPVAE